MKRLFFTSLLAMMACGFCWAQNQDDDSGIHTFVRVTSEDQLIPGARYLFVCFNPDDNNQALAMSVTSQNGKMRSSAKLTDQQLTTSQIDPNMQIIRTEINVSGKPVALILGGTKDAYTFYDKTATDNGGFVALPQNNSQSQLPVEHATEADDNAKFKIQYVENDETGAVVEKYLVSNDVKGVTRYIECRGLNNNGQPQFTCSSNGKPYADLYVEYTSEEKITLARSDKAYNNDEDFDYYATAYFGKDMKLDESMSALNVTPSPTTPETQVLSLSEVVPEGEILWVKTPVILKVKNDVVEANETGEKPEWVDYPIYTLTTESTDKTITTNLEGTLEDIDAPENSYKLRKQAIEVTDETGETEEVGTVAFFKAEGTSILANKAYYVLDEAGDETATTGGDVKVLTFAFSAATGIEKVNTSTELSKGAIYNLAGQQVNKNYRGVVLQNGKKYLRK